MTDKRIPLTDNFQFGMFKSAMDTLNQNKSQLSAYDLDIYRKLREGYDFAGRDLTITVKQMNHIKTVAADIVAGSYHHER